MKSKLPLPCLSFLVALFRVKVLSSVLDHVFFQKFPTQGQTSVYPLRKAKWYPVYSAPWVFFSFLKNVSGMPVPSRGAEDTELAHWYPVVLAVSLGYTTTNPAHTSGQQYSLQVASPHPRSGGGVTCEVPPWPSTHLAENPRSVCLPRVCSAFWHISINASPELFIQNCSS